MSKYEIFSFKSPVCCLSSDFPQQAGLVLLPEPCCQQLECFVQSARSGLVHREWDLLNTILVPQILTFRFKRLTGLLPRAVGCQSWHSAPWSHFLGPTFLISTSERSVEACSSPSQAAQGETPRLRTLSFLKIQPHLIIPWGSKHMEQPRSWDSRSGPATKPNRSTPRSQRFWQHFPHWENNNWIVLPTVRSHTWAAFCLSVVLCLATHPSQSGRGDAPGCGAHAALPCPVQRAASSSRGGGGWHRKEQEDGPGHVISVRHAERHQM